MKGIQTDFPELLRRRRGGSGRRLTMLPLGWGRGCSRCLVLLLHLLVMVLVLRGALVRLSGLGLGPIRSLRRRGGGSRSVLCHYWQRQCKHDERPENNSK